MQNTAFSQPGHVILTGAGGFIGKRLRRRLESHGTRVEVLDRVELGLLNTCVGEREIERFVKSRPGLKEAEAIFHLAGLAHTKIEPSKISLYATVNTAYTVSLLELAHCLGCSKFLYFSSVQAAGNPPATLIADESWSKPPESAYGQSKLEAEKQVASFCERWSIGYCILRPSLVYGPEVKGNLRALICYIAEKGVPRIPRFYAQRSVVGIDDVVEAALLAIGSSKAAGKTYILSDGNDCSMEQIINKVADSLGLEVPSIRVPESVMSIAATVGDLGELLFAREFPFNSELLNKFKQPARFSSKRIQSELGWAPSQQLLSELPAIIQSLRDKP